MPAADDIARLADELRGGSAFRLPGLVPSLAVSLVAHCLVVAALLSAMRPLASPVHILPVSLVDGPGSAGDGSGGAGGAPAEAPAATPVPAAAAPITPPPVAAAPPRRSERMQRPTPPSPAAPSAGTGEVAGLTHGTGAEGAGAGPGGTDGGGGTGGGGAGAAYGSNPLPPYPMVARRLGMQGRVELDVLVTADGHAADVRVLRSSGFAPLDTAAVTTVRERWRFVPARRGVTAVESRVTVPIVFRLDGVETGEPRG